MQKTIILKTANINKSKDKNFVSETLENIVSSLFDYPDVVTNIAFHKEDNLFYVKFNLKCCKTGDFVWLTIKEWMTLIAGTEEAVDVSIDEAEQDGTRILYKFVSYHKEDIS